MIIFTAYLYKAIITIIIVSDRFHYRNNIVYFISVIVNKKIEFIVDIKIVQGIE